MNQENHGSDNSQGLENKSDYLYRKKQATKKSNNQLSEPWLKDY